MVCSVYTDFLRSTSVVADVVIVPNSNPDASGVGDGVLITATDIEDWSDEMTTGKLFIEVFCPRELGNAPAASEKIVDRRNDVDVRPPVLVTRIRQKAACAPTTVAKPALAVAENEAEISQLAPSLLWSMTKVEFWVLSSVTVIALNCIIDSRVPVKVAPEAKLAVELLTALRSSKVLSVPIGMC